MAEKCIKWYSIREGKRCGEMSSEAGVNTKIHTYSDRDPFEVYLVRVSNDRTKRMLLILTLFNFSLCIYVFYRVGSSKHLFAMTRMENI